MGFQTRTETSKLIEERKWHEDFETIHWHLRENQNLKDLNPNKVQILVINSGKYDQNALEYGEVQKQNTVCRKVEITKMCGRWLGIERLSGVGDGAITSK